MFEDSNDETSMAVGPKKQKQRNVQSVQKKTSNKVQKKSPSMTQKNKSFPAGKNQMTKQVHATKAKNTKSESEDDNKDETSDDDVDDGDDEDETSDDDMDDDDDDEDETSDDDMDDDDQDDDDTDDEDTDDEEEDDDKAAEKSESKQKADTQKVKNEKQNNATEINNKKPENRQLTVLERKNKERIDQRDSRKIFISNIPNGTTVDSIKALSSNILDVIFPCKSSRAAKNNNAYAFLICKNKDVAVETSNRLQGTKLNGNKLEVHPFQVKSQTPLIDSKELLSTGFPSSTRIPDVAKLFPKASCIELTQDYRTAYITFECKEDAEEAFNATKNLNIKGLNVTVVFSGNRLLECENKERRDQRDACNLFMGNIPEGTTGDDIKALSGNIVDVYFPPRPPGIRVAYVTCKSPELVVETCAELQGGEMEVRPFIVRNRVVAIDPRQLRANGFPRCTRMPQVARLFPKACTITLTPDFRTAHIVFESNEDAEEAFNATENLNMKGHAVTVYFEYNRSGAAAKRLQEVLSPCCDEEKDFQRGSFKRSSGENDSGFSKKGKTDKN